MECFPHANQHLDWTPIDRLQIKMYTDQLEKWSEVTSVSNIAVNVNIHIITEITNIAIDKFINTVTTSINITIIIIDGMSADVGTSRLKLVSTLTSLLREGAVLFHIVAEISNIDCYKYHYH